MLALTTDQLLKLYEIETRQVHTWLDHLLTIRGMMALAFAAILSATLIYKQGVIALGALVFLAAWWWEYIYARYLTVYIDRVGELQEWLATVTTGTGHLPERYARGYDHRVIARFVRWSGTRRGMLGKEPISENVRNFLITFLDLPRAIAYLAMALAPLGLANVLGFPWRSP